MTLHVGFGERERQIIGKRLHRLDVVNLCSAVEGTPLTIAEWTNVILPLNQLSVVLLYGERTQHVKSEPFRRKDSIIKFVGSHHGSPVLLPKV